MNKSITGLALSFAVSACFATNPASVAYVDKQIAITKAALVAQINSGSSIAHPVGSCYGGGVVFYVNPDGTAAPGHRGLIMGLSDTPSPVAWDSSSGTAVTGTLPGYFTGDANTAAILSTNNSTSPPSWPAADAAVAYNTTPNAPCPGETCSNWYLPSQYELNQLYLMAVGVSGFGTNCPGYHAPSGTDYWSSTQYDANNAWEVAFTIGQVSSIPSGFTLAVRPVRAF